MTKRSWTKDETLALINLYKENTILWDRKSEDYRNRNKKARVIADIAKKLNLNGEEIQRKLHNLRNQVSQELNKIKKKKYDGVHEQSYTVWPYFLSLKFLIPSLTRRSNLSSAKDIQEVFSTNDDENANQEDDVIIKKEIEIIRESNGTDDGNKNAEKDRHKFLKRNEEKTVENRGLFQHSLDINSIERDECERFGDYVAMELRSLHSDTNRRRLKSEIRKAIARIADEDDYVFLHSRSNVPSPVLRSSLSPSSMMRIDNVHSMLDK